MKLRRIVWTPVQPLYPNADTLVSYGSIGGMRVLSVMGYDDGWYACPMYGAFGGPRAIELKIQRRRPSARAAKAAARDILEDHITFLTKEEE